MLHKKRKPSTFTNNGNTKVNAVNNMLHSKSTYFYRWGSIVPSVCGVALLCGVGLVFNPITNDNKVDKAFAETVTANPTSYSSVSMTISNSTSGELSSGDTVTTNVEPGLVNYIDNNIKISTSRINRFYVTVQATEDSTSELTGTAHGETIAPVGKDITVDDFGDNTWGYALGEVNTANVDFVYNPLPTYNTVTKPQYSSESNLADGDYNLKLTFAAKINADKPSDHYTTKAMVSVAADAKAVATLGNITKMSQMTSSYCASLPTPSVDADIIDVPQGQLIDDREGDNGTKYWVAKLADGNCWMTQNMAYSGIAATSGNFNQTNKNKVLNGSTATDIGTREPSDDPNMTEALSADGKTYNAHYRIGNYYPQNSNAAVQACDFSSKGNSFWKLPTNNNNGSFGYLITTKYSIGSNAAGSTKLQSAPLYFLRAGYYNSGLNYVGDYGYYWSSTSTYYLGFSSSDVNPSNSTSSYVDRGYSVRCLVSGS